jgi:hypothetical protein
MSWQAESGEVIVVVLLMRVLVAMALPGKNQAGSRLIKVNQTKSNQIKPADIGGGYISRKKHRKRRSYCGCVPYARFRGYALGLAKIKPNQACGAGGAGRNWTCRWRKRAAECRPLKPEKEDRPGFYHKIS